MIHITDWLPTLITAAGGNASNLTSIDGVNLWNALSEDTESPRTNILHNIDDIYGVSAITVGDWKFIQGIWTLRILILILILKYYKEYFFKSIFSFFLKFILERNKYRQFNSVWFFIGSTYNGVWDGWYGPSGREWIYDADGVISSTAGRAIASVGLSVTTEIISSLRENAMIKCPPRNDSLPICKPLEEPCLFNIYQDPCEDNNLVKQWVKYYFILF